MNVAELAKETRRVRLVNPAAGRFASSLLEARRARHHKMTVEAGNDVKKLPDNLSSARV
jgi:hypothetical protein